jgi:hypothetical protein
MELVSRADHLCQRCQPIDAHSVLTWIRHHPVVKPVTIRCQYFHVIVWQPSDAMDSIPNRKETPPASPDVIVMGVYVQHL